MCKTHNYTEVATDGHILKHTEYDLCSRSRYDVPCEKNSVYDHPATHIGKLSPRAAYDHFPPTPPRSSHSQGGSDSERSTKRRSGMYYIDGDKVIDLRKSSPGRRSRRNSVSFDFNEPHLSRSPPRRHHSVRITAPQSPRLNDELFQVSDPKELEQMVDGRPLRSAMKGHSRRSSRGSQASNEEEHLRRRRLEELYIHTKEDDEREARLKKQIARENAIINNRPAAVPDPPSVTSSNRSYRRPSVVVDRSHDLTSKMAAMDIRERRQQQKREQRAEEDQQQRLRDRMSPRRSAAPDDHYRPSRRASVSYPNGYYH